MGNAEECDRQQQQLLTATRQSYDLLEQQVQEQAQQIQEQRQHAAEVSPSSSFGHQTANKQLDTCSILWVQGHSVTAHCVADADLQSQWIAMPTSCYRNACFCMSTMVFILAMLLCSMLLHAWLHSMCAKGKTPQTHIISCGNNLASHIACL